MAPGTEPAEAPSSLADRLELTGWAARRWIDLVERLVEPAAIEGGLGIAKRRRGPTVRVSPGEISAMAPDPPRSRRTVSFLAPVIDHEHWERCAKQAAEQPILSAKIIAGDLPPEVERAAIGADLLLMPRESELSVRRGRVPLEWDEMVCGCAIVFGKRLEAEPGLLLAFRGMTPGDFQELVRQRAALTTAGGKGAAAYAQRPPIGPDREPPPLELSLDSFWSAGPALRELETPIRPPASPHSLLRRLGASPFERASFPLIGLLASCYDFMTESELRRAAGEDPVEDLDEDLAGEAGEGSAPASPD